jgi:hypothetical protein
MQTEVVEHLGEYHTLRSAAAITGKSARTLQLYVRFRRFPFITVGGTVMVKLHDLRVVPGVAARLDSLKAEMTDGTNN